MGAFTKSIIMLQNVRIVGFIEVIADSQHDHRNQNDKHHRQSHIHIMESSWMRLRDVRLNQKSQRTKQDIHEGEVKEEDTQTSNSSHLGNLPLHMLHKTKVRDSQAHYHNTKNHQSIRNTATSISEEIAIRE